jgi:hypothetical protein
MRPFALASKGIPVNKIVKRRTVWSEDKLEKALSALKISSFEQAAQRLNVTQASLSRALRRRGFSIRAHMARPKAKPAPAPAHFKSDFYIGENAPFLAMQAFESKPDNGCSWPLGDLAGDSFSFCGKPRAAKGAYCPECFKRAYEPSLPLSMRRALTSKLIRLYG